MINLQLDLWQNYTLTYDRSTVLSMTNTQTFTCDKNAVQPMTKIQFDLWQIHILSCDKNTHWPMTKVLHQYRLTYHMGPPFSVAQVVSAEGSMHWRKGCRFESHSSSIFLGKDFKFNIVIKVGLWLRLCNLQWIAENMRTFFVRDNVLKYKYVENMQVIW